MNRERVAVVVDRELRTIGRARPLLVLSLGFALVVLGLAWTGGPVGFVPVVLTLETPLEVLVPAVAVAFGYRAFPGDARRGELEILRTFPVTRRDFVLGVYLGRATGVLVTLLVPLVLAGIVVVVLGGARSSVFATHTGVDSVLLYLRFVALTMGYGLVVLAVALAGSTVARSVRGAVALGVALLVAVVVGFDLGIIVGLAGGVVPDGALQWLLALSPNSAYRGLVLSLVVGPVGTSTAVAPLAGNILGLLTWTVGSLAVTVRTVWRDGT